MTGFNLIIIPDEEDVEAAEVFVEGTIGGKPYRFLLDTGAGKTSVISDDYLSTFASAGQNQSSGVFARHSEDLITVPSITVGPISRENFTVVRMKAGEIRSLIGMDLLKDDYFHFDFAENRVSIEREDDAPYPFNDLFLDKKAHPYVDVQFGNVAAHTVWDTGASITVVDTNFIQKHPQYFAEAGVSVGTDSTGATMETPMFTISQMTIGGIKFPPHRAAGVDLSFVNAGLEVPMDLILGYSTLSKANWIFDFPRKRWAISKRLFE